jgi:hypothetical protein
VHTANVHAPQTAATRANRASVLHARSLGRLKYAALRDDAIMRRRVVVVAPSAMARSPLGAAVGTPHQSGQQETEVRAVLQRT